MATPLSRHYLPNSIGIADMREDIIKNRLDVADAILILRTWGLEGKAYTDAEEGVIPTRSTVPPPRRTRRRDLDWYNDHENQERDNIWDEIGIRCFDWQGPSWEPTRGEVIKPPPPHIRHDKHSDPRITREAVAAYLLQHPDLSLTKVAEELHENYSRVRGVASEIKRHALRPGRRQNNPVFADLSILAEVIRRNPDAPFWEIALSLDIGESTVQRTAKHYGIVRKRGTKP